MPCPGCELRPARIAPPTPQRDAPLLSRAGVAVYEGRRERLRCKSFLNFAPVPSPSLDSVRPHSPHPTLDLRVCADIGQRLSRVRTERSLSLNDLSSTLLLSPRQVRALESAEVSAFHNASFFMIGLRKYAAVCGVDRELVESAVMAVPEDEQQVDETIAALRDANTEPRDWTPILAILGVCVVVGLGWAIFRYTRAASLFTPGASTAASAALSGSDTPDGSTVGGATSPTPTTAASSPADASATPPDPAVTAPPGEVPAAAPPSQGADVLAGQVAYGSLWAPTKAWMFLRMENDTVIERTVAAGELVQLPSRPKYLAIGSGDAELTIGITPVDVSRFVQKGTLRMGVGEFGLAEQSVLGNSVPEPPAPPSR